MRGKEAGCLPRDRVLAMCGQVVIGFAEVFIPKEAAVCGEGGWMCRGKYEVAYWVDQGFFMFCVRSPQHEYYVLFFLGNGMDNGICECLPSLVLV